MILKTAVQRAQVGCEAKAWQLASRRKLNARYAEQRHQDFDAQLNRVRSALSQVVMKCAMTKLNVHAVVVAVVAVAVSGQLRFQE
jgi:hypothetical protein